MRELTIHDLDAELAEQLPARELMGGGMGGPHGGVQVTNIAVAGNSSHGFINFANGNQIQAFTLLSSNGNYAYAG